MSYARELLLAILALDSCNSEYAAGVVVEGDRIGLATFKNHEQTNVSEVDNADWYSAAFNTAAYELPGVTVISCRGMDDLDLSSAVNDVPVEREERFFIDKLD